MKLDDFDKQARQIIFAAQDIAASYDQKQVGTAHLALALVRSDSPDTEPVWTRSKDRQALDEALEDLVRRAPKHAGAARQFLSPAARTALDSADKLRRSQGQPLIGPLHILLGLLRHGLDPAADVLRRYGLDFTALVTQFMGTVKKPAARPTPATSKVSGTPALERFAIDLNEQVRRQPPRPVFGRDDEIRSILQVLGRKEKANPILVGEAGVGKLAIVETIAARINDNTIASVLSGTRIYALDLTALLAGAKYKGDFESRLRAVIDSLEQEAGRAILFVNDIHRLTRAGGGANSLTAAGVLQPALQNDRIRIVGATTPGQYQRHVQAHPVLERFFQPVRIDELSPEETVATLRRMRPQLEAYHRVRYTDDALTEAVRLAARYLPKGAFPEKALDLLDEAGAKLRLELDSQPAALVEVDRLIEQLELRVTADGSPGVRKELEAAKAKREDLLRRWTQERDYLQIIRDAKDQLAALEKQAEEAEEKEDFDTANRIKYEEQEKIYARITEAEKALRSIPDDQRLVRDSVSGSDIAEIVAQRTGIPVRKMMAGEREKLLHLEEEISRRLIGQKKAVRAVANAIRRSRSGLQPPGRPIGSFIFLGPTGVGKTQLAKTLAYILFDDESAMIRLDMSEYQEGHQVSRLIGAPPGYVGFDDGGQLTEAVRRRPYAIVLLDEIEKAHQDVYNMLLQVLDDGRLTDNKGRVADFSNTIIIMTSNLGASTILENFEDLEALGDKHREEIIATTEKEVFELLKEKMPPEFLNRIDEKIMFRPLTKEEIKQIMHLLLRTTEKMLAQKNIRLSLSKKAENFLVEKGFDPKFGARPMKRAIQRELVDPLAFRLIAGDFKEGDHIWVEARKGKLEFSHKRVG